MYQMCIRDRLDSRVLHVVVGEDHLAAVQRQDFAFFDGVAAVLAVPGGKGHRTGGHVVRGLHPFDEVFLHEMCIRDRLRHDVRGGDVNFCAGDDRLCLPAEEHHQGPDRRRHQGIKKRKPEGSLLVKQ